MTRHSAEAFTTQPQTMDNANRTQPTRRDNGPAGDDDNTTAAAAEQQPIVKNTTKEKKKGTKTLWVTVFKCFYCGKHGHNLPKCRQCSQAYYCNADCQRKHWKKHKPVCRVGLTI